MACSAWVTANWEIATSCLSFEIHVIRLNVIAVVRRAIQSPLGLNSVERRVGTIRGGHWSDRYVVRQSVPRSTSIILPSASAEGLCSTPFSTTNISPAFKYTVHARQPTP